MEVSDCSSSLLIFLISPDTCAAYLQFLRLHSRSSTGDWYAWLQRMYQTNVTCGHVGTLGAGYSTMSTFSACVRKKHVGNFLLPIISNELRPRQCYLLLKTEILDLSEISFIVYH